MNTKKKIIFLASVLFTVVTVGFLITPPQAHAQVTPSITVISPNGGERLIKGGTYDIRWDYTGLFSAVTISFGRSGQPVLSSGETLLEIGPISNTGSYSWTVPQDLITGLDYVIAIRNFDDVSVFGSNSAIFGIVPRPSVKVTYPNGGERLEIGKTHEVSWTIADDFLFGNEITLHIRSDKDPIHNQTINFPTVLYSTASGNYTFQWTTEGMLEGDNYEFNVVLKGSGGIQSFSDGSDVPFSMVLPSPSITVISPYVGNIWVTGSTKLITWTSTGSFDQVGLTLMQNDVAVLGLGTVSNTGTHTLTVPTGFIGSGFKIRAVNMSDNSIFDDSASFSISKILPSTTVTSPNGGEQWVLGQSYTITWKSTASQVRVSLYSSEPYERFVKNIYTFLTNTGSVVWTPDSSLVVGDKYRISITDEAATGGSSDFSDSHFSIVAAPITVISPNGGEQWVTGEIHNIAWNAQGIDSVTLWLADFGISPITWYRISPDLSNLAVGKYSWKVGTCHGSICNFPAGGKYKIMVEESASSPRYPFLIADESNNYFSIVSKTETGIEGTDSDNSPDYTKEVPSYPITPEKYPDLFIAGVGKGDYVGGGPCLYGTEPNPTFCKPTSDIFTIYYDHCASRSQLNEAYVKSNGKLSAFGISPPTGYECQDGAFIEASIPASSITVTSPNGGELWEKGKTYGISWTTSGTVPNVAVFLDDSSGSISHVRDIVLSTPNSGSYNWLVDTTLSPHGKYKIRVSGVGSSASDISDSFFSVVDSALVSNAPTVVYPLDGQTLDLEGSYMFKVKLLEGASGYLFGLFQNGIMIYENFRDDRILSPDGEFALHPNHPFHAKFKAGNVMVRIRALIDGKWSRSRDISITLVPRKIDETKSITIISPNGGEKLQIGKPLTITWASSGITGNVSIGLRETKSLGTGAFVKSIAGPIANTGSYTWTPDVGITSGSSYIIRVNESFQSTFDDSDDFFSVIKSDESTNLIRVTSPNGGEVWRIGEQQEIRWESSQNIDQVTIALSKGGTYVKNLLWNIISTGSASWTPDVTLEEGSGYTIRITHPGSGIFDNSDHSFSILKFEQASCLEDGTLIKTPLDPKVYVIVDCQKRWIKTQEEFHKKGYEFENVQEIADPVIDAYADYLIAQANLLRAINQEKVYRIISGKKLWVPSAEAFSKQNLDWQDVQEVSEEDVATYPIANLVRVKGDTAVYYITDNGFKKWIRTAEIFNSYSGNKWEDIVDVVSEIVESFQAVELIRLHGGTKVYKLEGVTKRWIRTTDAFDRYNFDWKKIVSMNQLELNYYTEGGSIE